eukprot:gene5018-6247_t
MVHPDTLTNYPNERKNNATNMKIFMSIVDSYRKRPQSDPTKKPQVFNLSFYIPEKDAEGTNIPGQFRMVDVEMIQNSSNPNHIPTQLGKLFGLCNLPTTFLTEIDIIDNIKLPNLYGSVKTFLLDNKHYVQKQQLQSVQHQAELQSIIKKMKKDHKINISMITNSTESNYSFKENYQALQELSMLLSNPEVMKVLNHPIFKNVIINLDHSEVSYTSNEPVIYLDRSSSESWERYILNLDMQHIEEEVKYEIEESKKRAIQFQKEKTQAEGEMDQIQQLLKLKLLRWDPQHYDPTVPEEKYLSPNDQMTECLKFTNSLLKNKKEFQNTLRAKLGQGKGLQGLQVFLCPNLIKSDFFIDMEGYIKVSTKITPQEFINILIEQRPIVSEVQKQFYKYETIRDYAMVRLGLKELTCLNSLVFSHGHEKVYEAYQKLYDNAEKLRELGLSGLTIAIADFYSVSKSGDIYLKWDFNVKDIVSALPSPNNDQVKVENQEKEEQVEEEVKEQEKVVENVNNDKVENIKVDGFESLINIQKQQEQQQTQV